MVVRSPKCTRARTAGLVTDEQGLWTVLVEPSAADFDEPEEDELQPAARRVLLRILRVGLVLLLVVALLLYFVVPLGNIFTSVPEYLQRLRTGTHTIPLAPQHRSSPKLGA